MVEKISDQFRGLPMSDLIGVPLASAAEAQRNMANSTAEFIRQIGFEPATNTEVTAWNTARKDLPATMPWPAGRIRNARFAIERPSRTNPDQKDRLDVDIPLLAIVKVPALAITRVNITFDMEVKNSEREEKGKDSEGKMEGSTQVGWGPVSATVKLSGSVSSHESNTRSSDSSAKYKVDVYAEDRGTPEGLARVLDMLHGFMAPAIKIAGDAAALTARRRPTAAEITQSAAEGVMLFPEVEYAFDGARPRVRPRAAVDADLAALRPAHPTAAAGSIVGTPL